MKKFLCLIIFSVLLFSCGGPGSTAPAAKQGMSLASAIINFNFTQRTDDYARPLGGAEYWYGHNDYPIGYNPIDGYWRFLWNEIEPVQGQYNFAAFDAQLNWCVARGAKFNFAIMAQDDYYGGLPVVDGGRCTYPAALHFQMQAESVKDIKWTNGAWWQNFNSPSYIKDWTNMYAALAKHCIDAGLMKYIGYVEMACVGNSGEWTSSDATVGTARHPTTATLKLLCQASMNAFPDKYAVVLCSAFDAMQVANTRIPADFGEWLLKARTNAGLVGHTKKSWGDKSWWNVSWTFGNPTVMPDGFRFDSAIKNRSRYAPVTGEPSNFLNAANPGPFDDVDYEITQLGTSNIGNGNYEGTEIGNAHGIANMQAAFKKMGNRISLNGGNINGSTVTLNWINKGISPVYEDFDATIELRNSAGALISSVKTAFKLKLFMGSATSTDQLPGSGSGDLYLIIRDREGVRKPYPLGVTGQLADGSFLLAKNVTLGGGSIPVPPDTIPVPPNPSNCDTTIKVNRDSVYKVTHDTTVKISKDSLIHRSCTTPGSSVSIFTTQLPAAAVDNDKTGGDEKGIKFSSSVPGLITGVRFYKKAGMNGTHIGELYTSTGVRLAQASFTNETPSGWQSVLFLNPVAITAQTSYVAAVFYSDGNYIEDNDYFKGKSVINGGLTAPADGTNGASGKDPGTGQGFYIYSATPAFPNTLFRSANYWIDVSFTSAKP